MSTYLVWEKCLLNSDKVIKKWYNFYKNNLLICGSGLIKKCPVNFVESGKSIMAVDIITSENPYVLDYLPGDKKDQR